MEIKALLVTSCIKCERYGSFEFVNGHGNCPKGSVFA